MRIGITERGDAGIDLAWKDKLKGLDGAILITKNITPAFSSAVKDLRGIGFPFIIHCTCTGWGGSRMEPCVPALEKQLNALAALIADGIPKENCVIRIDPIFPNRQGLDRVERVLAYAEQTGLPPMRIRISIYDEYPHVRQRLADNGWQPLYGGKFYAPREMMEYAQERLKEFHGKYNILFETCAEPMLAGCPALVGAVKGTGCLSVQDLSIMGLDVSAAPTAINGQHRKGCLCLACKRELLTHKRPCSHKCVYCFWKD